MGQRGRPRKPAETRRREGNPRQHKIPDEVKFPVGGLSPCPTLDKVGRSKFDELAAYLTEAGICQSVDSDILNRYATAYSVYIKAVRQLAKEDLIVEGSQGTKPNPLIQIMKEREKAMNEIATHLGFSPIARTRIPPAAKPEEPTKEKSLEDRLADALKNNPGKVLPMKAKRGA